MAPQLLVIQKKRKEKNKKLSAEFPKKTEMHKLFCYLNVCIQNEIVSHNFHSRHTLCFMCHIYGFSLNNVNWWQRRKQTKHIRLLSHCANCSFYFYLNPSTIKYNKFVIYRIIIIIIINNTNNRPVVVRGKTNKWHEKRQIDRWIGRKNGRAREKMKRRIKVWKVHKSNDFREKKD